MTFSQLSLASVEAESFTGTFRTGNCPMTRAKEATITLSNNVLKVIFADDAYVTEEIFVESAEFSDSVVQVSKESFSITNLHFFKFEGAPVMKTRIARSATGNRVRLDSVNFEINAKSECVLYRK